MASNRFCETTRAWLNINVRVYRVYTYFISDPHYFLRSKSSAEVNNIRKAWRTERSSVVKLGAKLFDRRHIRGYMRNNFLWDLCFQKKALTGCIQRDEGSFTKPVLHTFLSMFESQVMEHCNENMPWWYTSTHYFFSVNCTSIEIEVERASSSKTERTLGKGRGDAQKWTTNKGKGQVKTWNLVRTYLLNVPLYHSISRTCKNEVRFVKCR